MSIAAVDDIASMLAVGQRMPLLKNFTAPKAAGAFQSGWLAPGIPGAGSAAPAYTAGSGYTCDRTTTGALGQANGAVQNWLARVSMYCSQPGVIVLADRLWSCSGMGFAASTYAVTTPGSLPARITDNGVGVEGWIENFVAAGAASGTATLTYVNPAGTASKTGVIKAVVSAPVAGQMQPFPLAAGDTGIKQVTNVITSATWTSGSFGVTLLKRLVEIPIAAAASASVQDWSQILQALPADACVFPFFLAQNTTAPSIGGHVMIGDK